MKPMINLPTIFGNDSLADLVNRGFDFDPLSFTMRPLKDSDIVENDTDYSIELDLPGLDRDDLEITTDGRLLSVSLTKQTERPERRERSYRNFKRTWTLSADIDRDKIVADMSKGVLVITLPKTDVPTSRQIKITGE
tara:strand:- start:544 stop:954 length:411 start_codon:yes stop_codon:yes gene_type:complete